MEKELFFSGYCRAADGSRTVTVVLDNGRITEVDCCYPSCVYAPGCPIGVKIQEAQSQ